MTHSDQVEPWCLCSTAALKNICPSLATWANLLLSSSQHGQLITWNSFLLCCCRWRVKTAKANHCSSWKSFGGENEILGPVSLSFILLSPLASVYGSDLISIFILSLFSVTSGQRQYQKQCGFGGFIYLSQWKKRMPTEMEGGVRGRRETNWN